MAEVSLLEKVKYMIGVTGNYQDTMLQLYIDEVKQYLIDGGVSEANAEAKTSAGIIARGVIDLWNYGAGDGKLSDYFKERAVQLAMKSKSGGSDTPGGDGGTENYNELYNKPQINGVELIGNKNSDELGLQPKIAEVDEEGVILDDPVIAPKVIVQEVEAENIYTNAEIDEMLENITAGEVDSITNADIDELLKEG